ncbi:5-formyltetrahydrofolate cyclo-ligase [Commensalibacter papalotli (ex Servin-Garciduenas et al. 2014)]|uniref:5-formyltetrahydrofolate cyclo-ligase n=2 Tax=Commensalibacter papalotli (ex Servin-Garciduenas et al. 2014) TaxID=1208583 RepID=W7DWA1_9PROT|nr:5-formyltetrahydrofolate cyclo-ligase [Commensalibacter papalotli (ex Servin-Garciduenas et al. 2014)]
MLMIDILQEKCDLRNRLKLLRSQSDQYHKQYTSFLIQNIVEFIHNSCATKDVIACFWPLDNEADLRPLLHQLIQCNYQVALPKTPTKGNPLSFHLWSPTVTMQEGRYKTMHPNTDIIEPNFILVPLMAFDRCGNRLGYGGGYYDRTLQQFSGINCAGVAFSYQEVTQVPTERFDFGLPVIITEQEIIYI